jgi:hypothetical protein
LSTQWTVVNKTTAEVRAAGEERGEGGRGETREERGERRDVRGERREPHAAGSSHRE